MNQEFSDLGAHLMICWPYNFARCLATQQTLIPAFALFALAGSTYASSLTKEQTPIVVAAGVADVEGGIIPLSTDVSETIVELNVEEGDVVEKGAIILKLDDTLAALALEEASAGVELAKTKLAESKQAQEAHIHKLAQAEQLVIVAQSKAHSQQRQVDKMAKLKASGAIDEETFLAQSDALTALKAGVISAKEQYEALKSENVKLLVQASELTLKMALSKYQSAKEYAEKHVLKAPSAGKILRLQVAVGQLFGGLRSQTSLILFYPQKPTVIRCDVEQEFVDRIQVGMTVKVRNENSEKAEWTGKIKRIADWVAPRRSVFNRGLELSDVPTVECIVELDPAQEKLRIGQKVRALIFSQQGSDNTLQ